MCSGFSNLESSNSQFYVYRVFVSLVVTEIDIAAEIHEFELYVFASITRKSIHPRAYTETLMIVLSSGVRCVLSIYGAHFSIYPLIFTSFIVLFNLSCRVSTLIRLS